MWSSALFNTPPPPQGQNNRLQNVDRQWMVHLCAHGFQWCGAIVLHRDHAGAVLLSVTTRQALHNLAAEDEAHLEH
ncbi:hypothetical protein O3P69_005383 [Scylla paramamosain]|uniref:Uncharacterized protein n=1 Tax=Scylla paramamosain TaxID=85552 RepID=A0AAW0U880_SCYPA